MKSLRAHLAGAAGSLSRWTLRSVFHRDAYFYPGKLGLQIDPHLISHFSGNLTCGSLCVVGTNGKTTTTNLIAESLKRAGCSVCYNRTGANMASGVASALLEDGEAEWGVFECDELWLVKILPELKSKYVVLLNLFRDQLDRAGEIEVVQNRILDALDLSPETTLVYNADDPLCARIALAAKNPKIAFGVDGSLGLTESSVSEGQICQNCTHALSYDVRQYGQLGIYHCDACGFERPDLQYSAKDVVLDERGASFSLVQGESTIPFSCPAPGAYMVYNVAAAATTALLTGCEPAVIQQALDEFKPENGRLQRLNIFNHDVLLNLAKNPAGMDQSVAIALGDVRPFALGIFINDKEADGHDVSWLWDVDFEKLAERSDIQIFAGGIRKNDLQVRLKYAGVSAALVEDAADLMAHAEALGADCPVYAIANYTSLPGVKATLEHLATKVAPLAPAADAVSAPAVSSGLMSTAENPLVIVHLYPDLLNLYGDRGNVMVLKQRLAWRGIPVEVRTIGQGDAFDLADADLVFLGGGPDREQEAASTCVAEHAAELRAFIEQGGTCLAICGGYQMLGRSWILNGEEVPGLGIGAFETRRAGTARDRLVDNIALEVPGISHPVIGYENHAGRTHLDDAASAFGRVISPTGHGNNDESGYDGYVYKQLVATYLHGPLLGKNPELADRLLRSAVDSWAERVGVEAPVLEPLDDTEERAANVAMAARMGLEAARA